MIVPEAGRLPSLNTIRIPEGADDLRVRKTLLNDFRLEIGGGLGNFAGKAWRVGLMGYSSSKKNVILFLSALFSILNAQGVKVKPGAVEAASAVYAKA
jgi:alanine-glyoxylate transaminase/serine-glyoxylate transaminase/serine-pyruvate transaminase